MAWVTPRTWVAGTTVLASWMNEIRDSLKAIGDPWTAYTPTVVNVTTSATTAKYVLAGKWVVVRFSITLSAAPSAIVTLSLPATASTAYGTGAQAAIGTASGNRGGTYYHGVVYQASSTTVSLISHGATSPWTAAVPGAWASGDIWSGTFTYEAA